MLMLIWQEHSIFMKINTIVYNQHVVEAIKTDFVSVLGRAFGPMSPGNRDPIWAAGGPGWRLLMYSYLGPV